MKKKFKKGLLALLLAPTMLFAAACTKSIPSEDFVEKMTSAAENYYSATNTSKKTMELKINSENSWKEKVEYGAEDENSVEKEFKSVTETSQKIEMGYKDAKGNELLRVTEKTKTTTNGFQEKADETGVESVTNVEEEKVVTTFVTILGLNEEPDQYKAYIETTTKENDDEAVVEKEIYTYSIASNFKNAIVTVLDRVDSRWVEDNFFIGTSLEMLNLMGGTIEYYKDGRKAFGMNGSYGMTSVSDGEIEINNMNFDIRFENNLPAKVTMSSEESVKNSYLPEEDRPSEINPVNNYTGELTISYSCGAIEVPAGFEDADATYSAPSISVASMSVGSFL